jgi:hypothetical protein
MLRMPVVRGGRNTRLDQKAMCASDVRKQSSGVHTLSTVLYEGGSSSPWGSILHKAAMPIASILNIRQALDLLVSLPSANFYPHFSLRKAELFFFQ